jgi:site-specific recombinase XerD
MAREFQHNFINHLRLQRVAPKTREAYLRAVADISAYHNHPAAELNNDQIQDFLHHCIQEKQLAWSSCNVLFCAMKKYYREYLGRDESGFSIPPRPRSKQLPMLLSREEANRIVNVPVSLKHRALLATVYGSGLRVSEVVRLRPEHIESSRMMIRIEQAKGAKDRYTVLSKKGLELLRQYWREYRPGEWVFFGRDKNIPMSVCTAQRIYYQAKAKAGITKGRGIHTLRHCFATHLLDQGVDLFIIKRWLGHSAIKTTCRYIHTSPEQFLRIQSPLDLLYKEANS